MQLVLVPQPGPEEAAQAVAAASGEDVDVEVGHALADVVVHPDERAQAVEDHMRCMAGEAYPQAREMRLMGNGEKTVFVEVLGGPLWEDNKVVGVQQIVRDITSQTRLAQELEVIIEMLPAAFVINDFKGKAYRANSRILELTGYTREEILSMKSLVNLYWHPEDREESMRLLRENGEFYNREFTARLKGDKKMEVAMHAKVIEIGGETYIASLCQDNSERKELQERLKRTTEILERTFNAVEFGIVHLDPTLRVLFANTWTKTRLPSIEPGKKCRAPFMKGNRPCTLCPAQRSIKSGKPEKEELKLDGPGGVEMRLQISAFPIRNEEGEIVQITELIKDLNHKPDRDRDIFSW